MEDEFVMIINLVLNIKPDIRVVKAFGKNKDGELCYSSSRSSSARFQATEKQNISAIQRSRKKINAKKGTIPEGAFAI